MLSPDGWTRDHRAGSSPLAHWSPAGHSVSTGHARRRQRFGERSVPIVRGRRSRRRRSGRAVPALWAASHVPKYTVVAVMPERVNGGISHCPFTLVARSLPRQPQPAPPLGACPADRIAGGWLFHTYWVHLESRQVEIGRFITHTNRPGHTLAERCQAETLLSCRRVK